MEIAGINLGYFRILFQSNLLECFVFAAFYWNRNIALCKLSAKKSFAMTTCANCITHPVVFFGWMASGIPYFWAVLGAEMFAIVGEFFIHSFVLSKNSIENFSRKQVLAASIVANLVSWQLGPMLTFVLNKII
jgi:hypothetical protein